MHSNKKTALVYTGTVVEIDKTSKSSAGEMRVQVLIVNVRHRYKKDMHKTNLCSGRC